MKFILFLLLFFSSVAGATEKAVGLGFSTAGSGVSGYFQRQNSFFQGLLGLTGSSPVLVLDYCLETPLSEITAYYGGGSIIDIGRSSGLGVHVPLGLSYKAKDTPLLLSIEIAPGVFVTRDDTFSMVDLTASIRFFF